MAMQAHRLSLTRCPSERLGAHTHRIPTPNLFQVTLSRCLMLDLTIPKKSLGNHKNCGLEYCLSNKNTCVKVPLISRLCFLKTVNTSHPG